MNEEKQPEKHLKLTTADLNPQFQEPPPKQAKFFHFNERLTAKAFQEATLITFVDHKGNEHIMKDLYNRLIK